MKGLFREEGLTLIELSIGLAVTALFLAPMATVVYQVSVAPVETSTEQSVVNQGRNVAINLPDDGRSAQSVITGDNPLWATSAWTDFTESTATYHTVDYAWVSGDDTMVRQVYIDGITTGSFIIGRFLDKFADADIGFNPNLPPFLLETFINPEEETVLSTQKRKFSLVSFMRAPAALPQPAGGYAVFSTDGVKVSGSDNGVIGNVHSSGDITVSGSDHHVAGFVEATQDISLNGQDITIEFMNEASTTKSLPVSFSTVDFQPFTFDFVGDVDLKNVDEVWFDQERTQLKPGVYHTTGYGREPHYQRQRRPGAGDLHRQRHKAPRVDFETNSI